jgi:hypothetical protein
LVRYPSSVQMVFAQQLFLSAIRPPLHQPSHSLGF